MQIQSHTINTKNLLEERAKAIRQEMHPPEAITPPNLISIGHPAVTKEPRTQYNEQRVHNETW